MEWVVFAVSVRAISIFFKVNLFFMLMPQMMLGGVMLSRLAECFLSVLWVLNFNFLFSSGVGGWGVKIISESLFLCVLMVIIALWPNIRYGLIQKLTKFIYINFPGKI